MLKIICVVGTRPEFSKLAGLLYALSDMELWIVHTGQHYDDELSKEFWEDLQLPKPRVNLQVGSGSHVYQLIKTMSQLEGFVDGFRPNAVLVIGDANPTLAGALTANKMGVDVIHVEAGLRSFDRSMPEEINRKLIDVVSELLFVTEPDGMLNLMEERLEQNAHLVGNVMADTLRKNKERIDNSDVLERLGVLPEYILCTLHRPANVDDKYKMAQIEKELLRIDKECQIVFPRHPRTKLRKLKAYPPLKYTEFIKLLTCAKMVITDSGGVQEEALAVQTPCLTLRASTERPITLEHGANCLIEPEALYGAYRETLERKINFQIPQLWDGFAAGRIAKIIKSKYQTQRS